MKYKVGDRIRILEASYHDYSSVSALSKKKELVGKIFEISMITNYTYQIKDGIFSWYFKEDEVEFAPLLLDIGDKVTVIGSGDYESNISNYAVSNTKAKMLNKQFNILSIQEIEGKFFYQINSYYFSEREVEKVVESSEKTMVKSLAQLSYENLNLKIGDKVKVVMPLPVGVFDIQGWSKTWVESMNEAVGKTFTVSHTYSSIFSVDFTENHYCFPTFVLEKVNSIDVKLNENYTATVTKDSVQVGCQNFDAKALQNLVDTAREIGMTIK